MGRNRWHVSDDGDIEDEINRCPDAIKADFLEMYDRLVMNPRDPALGVASHHDWEWPEHDSYIVPFDDAILFYSLTADIPTIRLQAIVWLTDPPMA